MIEVGAFEAKTHLSALLERVRLGENVLITKRGEPIAWLVPARRMHQERLAETVKKLLTLRSDMSLGGLNWRDLRDEGRQ